MPAAGWRSMTGFEQSPGVRLQVPCQRFLPGELRVPGKVLLRMIVEPAGVSTAASKARRLARASSGCRQAGSGDRVEENVETMRDEPNGAQPEVEVCWESGHSEAAERRKLSWTPPGPTASCRCCLARPERLELPTPWFEAKCSDPTELRARAGAILRPARLAVPAQHQSPPGGASARIAADGIRCRVDARRAAVTSEGRRRRAAVASVQATCQCFCRPAVACS